MLPAQAEPEAVAPATAIGETNAEVPAAPDWRRDPALDAKITFEAQRMPLKQVLAALTKQGHVRLDGSDLSTAKRVTMAVRDMSLRDAMTALETLYQAKWQAAGEGGFVLKSIEQAPWQNQLARLGNLQDWGYYRTWWQRSFAPPYLSDTYTYDWDALLDEMGRDELQSPEGVRFDSLSVGLQQKLRRISRWSIVYDAVSSLKLRAEAEKDWTLRITPADAARGWMTNREASPPWKGKIAPLMVEFVSQSESPKSELLMFDFKLAPFIPEPLTAMEKMMKVHDEAIAAQKAQNQALPEAR